MLHVRDLFDCRLKMKHSTGDCASSDSESFQEEGPGPLGVCTVKFNVTLRTSALTGSFRFHRQHHMTIVFGVGFGRQIVGVL